jgi:hypothetical protein
MQQLCNLVCECPGECDERVVCCKCGIPEKPCTKCGSGRTEVKDPGWSEAYIQQLWTFKGLAMSFLKLPPDIARYKASRATSIPSLMNVANQMMATITLAIIINGAVTYGVRDFELIQNTEGLQPTAHWRRGCIGAFSALFPVLWLESYWRRRGDPRYSNRVRPIIEMVQAPPNAVGAAAPAALRL